MTDPQWQTMLRLVEGHAFETPPVGLLVDGPWISWLHGISLIDYYASDRLWLEANLSAVRRFPDVIMLAGFWGEFGMSTNPSAFGCRCLWPEEGFPTVEKLPGGCEAIGRLKKPDCRTDGLHPWVLKRLEHGRPAMEKAGHRIRLASSHGPLTIAAYLVGHTDLMIGVRTEPERIEKLLGLVTDFVVDWIVCQQERFPTIEGILVLEDLMGFLGEADFARFALPYMTRIFAAIDVPVRMLHNDAFGLITARHLAKMRVNLFNFSFEHPVARIRHLAGPEIALMGNVPPRDVLGRGGVDEVRRCVAEIIGSVDCRRGMLVSAGGFVPPGATAEKLDALCETARTRGKLGT